MSIRSKLSSKKIFLGFILIFTVFFTTLPLAYGLIPSIESVGSNFFMALVIGGIPFVIYHFIIGDKKKKAKKE